jgi:flavin reductase (DIM6/NTAB) family NADH-FMN oxidoreductase RutF
MTPRAPIRPAPRPSVSRDELRRAASAFPTGVAIVTSQAPGGEPKGITVNSFTSVSLDPPMVLICVDKRSSSAVSIREGGAYAVHLLRPGQRGLALAFARPVNDKFATISWKPGQEGAPLIADCPVVFECQVAGVSDGGDHDIVLGRVTGLHAEPALAMLGFFRGQFLVVEQGGDGPNLLPESFGFTSDLW